MHVYRGCKTTSHAVPWELSTPSETKTLADLELTKSSEAAQIPQLLLLLSAQGWDYK